MNALFLVLAVCSAVCSADYLQDLKMWDPEICCYPVPSGCCPQCLDCLDVAFILDDSSSITATQFMAIKDFLIGLESDPQLPGHPDLQTAMVKFATDATVVWNWGDVVDEAQYIAAVNGMTQMGGWTRPVTGMELVENAVIGSEGDRDECPNTCVIITDGLAQNDIPTLLAAGDQLRAACGSLFVVGVTINVPPAGVANFDAQLMAMAGDNADYKFTVEMFEELPDRFQDVIDMWCEEFGSDSSEDCCPFDFIFMISNRPRLW